MQAITYTVGHPNAEREFGRYQPQERGRHLPVGGRGCQFHDGRRWRQAECLGLTGCGRAFLVRYNDRELGPGTVMCVEAVRLHIWGENRGPQAA